MDPRQVVPPPPKAAGSPWESQGRPTLGPGSPSVGGSEGTVEVLVLGLGGWPMSRQVLPVVSSQPGETSVIVLS